MAQTFASRNYFYSTFFQPPVSTKVLPKFELRRKTATLPRALTRKDFILSHKILSNEDESIFSHIFFTGAAVASSYIV